MMNRLDLRPTRARHRGQPDPAPKEVTPEDFDRIQAALLTDHSPGACPRCGAPLDAHPRDDIVPDDHHIVWSVECAHCGFHANLRSFADSGPVAPRFETLIVSRRDPDGLRKAAPGSVGSTVFHALAIYAAVVATSGAAVRSAIVQDTTMVYLTAQQEEQEPEQAREEEPPPPSLVSLAAPPPKGFLTVDIPAEMPTEIPPIDLTQRFDPRDYSGIGVEGGVFEGVEGGTGEVPTTFNGVGAYLESAVDEPPEMVSHPPLRYPEFLRRAGIEGTVRLEFVVDTTGEAMAETMKAVRADQPAFVASATTMMQGARFRPGRVRGHIVRVLVEVDVVFSIIPAGGGE